MATTRWFWADQANDTFVLSPARDVQIGSLPGGSNTQTGSPAGASQTGGEPASDGFPNGERPDVDSSTADIFALF